MTQNNSIFPKALLAAVAIAALSPAIALAGPDCARKPDHHSCTGEPPDGGDGGGDPPVQPGTVDLNWMHSDVQGAWDMGLTGANAVITVIDDFGSGNGIPGYLVDKNGDGALDGDDIVLGNTHGDWTSLQSAMIAFGAEIRRCDFDGAAVDGTCQQDASGAIQWNLAGDPERLHVVNQSYGLIARASFASAFNNWDNLGQQDKSVLTAVQNDIALAVQSAGNDGNGVAVGGTVKGQTDVLARQYVRIIDGSVSAADGDVCTSAMASDCSYLAPVIFAGALQWNADNVDEGGATESIASYSTIAGDNEDVQRHYLMVGVEGGRANGDELANYRDNCGTSGNGTCLYGTSFAAPIISGYAALVADKFVQEGTGVPLPSEVAKRLLSTANRDTIDGWNMAIHGQGEADLSRAIAPDWMN